MRSRRLSVGRSPAEWATRAILLLIAGMIGYTSTSYSLAQALERQDPARALVMAPGDGQALALLAQQRFADQPSARDQSSVIALAMRALRQEPTAVPAVATLGFVAQLRNETTKARRLFAYAQLLSRRDLHTEVWAIEDAVARGNVRDALRHYDIALRTSKAAPEILFPVLGDAIAEPSVRTGLVAVLAKRPPWANSFTTFLGTSKSDPRAIAALFMAIRKQGIDPSGETASALVARLVDASLPEAAWQFYASGHPTAPKDQLRNPRFTDDVTAPSAFDWTPVSEGVITSSIQADHKNGLFEFALPSAAGGTVLRQTVLVSPGRYRLFGRSSDIVQPRQSLPYWVLSCHDGREAGRVDVTKSAEQNGEFAGIFTVPADCSSAVLSLVARASDAPAGSTGQINHVTLSRVD